MEKTKGLSSIEKRKIKKLKQRLDFIFSFIIVTISIIFLTWVLLSWLEVISQNIELVTPKVYHKWNFFEVMINSKYK